MSKRRQAGEWVWLAPYAGFTGESNRLKAEIQPETEADWTPCSLCEDEDCREWNNLWTEPDPKSGGRRHVLPHVAECQMFDEKQGPTEQARPEEGEGQPVEKGGDERPEEKGPSPIRQPKVTDSSADTLKHIARVREILQEIESNLFDREIDHDSSKLGPEEKPVFDEFTPKLAGSIYGSEEYKGFLKAMKPALDHHYKENRHHPEHFDNGIDGMTLVDLVEMLADWKAASERHATGDIRRSVEVNAERFKIGDQLKSILLNTIKEMGW